MLQNLLRLFQPLTGALKRVNNLWELSKYEPKELFGGEAILKKPYKPNKKLAKIIELWLPP